MYRKSGAIPPVNGERIPKLLMIFDTESYRGEPVNGVEYQTLRLGVAHFFTLDRDINPQSEEWLNFTTVEELLSFILYHTRKDKTLYVYAHNIKYDLALSGLLTALVSEGFKSSLFVIDDPPTFMRFKRGRMSIMFVDTFNYWQYSLKEMGEQLGLPKLSVNFDSGTTEELLVYCRRDVEVLTNYLLTFIRFLVENDLSPLGLTLASQSFKAYRHRFMRREIILHNRPEVLELERAGYYGGRTDAFYIGVAPEQDYYKLDVNSMYPYVMRENVYPTELVGYSVNIPLDRLREHLDKYYCLATVTLVTQTPAYPYVNGFKLVFPVGEFTTTLHHPELVYALERGEIKTVHKLAIYNRGDIFSQYVNYFYALKVRAEEQGDKITRKVAKIMLNSLYGKFGQREVVSKIVNNNGEEKYQRLTGYSEKLGRRVEVNYLGNVIELRYKGGESFYSSPVIAGAVTAYARMYLWELISCVGYDNTYYCDTDSLIVTKAGYDNARKYISQSVLGKLKVEGVERILIIHSVKDYVYGSEIKVKGVPKSAKMMTDGVWKYEQFRGGKTWLSQGLPVGVEVYTRIKQRRSSYDKGIVTPTGRVIPLLIA